MLCASYSPDNLERLLPIINVVKFPSRVQRYHPEGPYRVSRLLPAGPRVVLDAVGLEYGMLRAEAEYFVTAARDLSVDGLRFISAWELWIYISECV